MAIENSQNGSQQFRVEAGLKRYKIISQFVDFANLYERFIEDGVTWLKIGDARLREDALPALAWVDAQDTQSYAPEYELPDELQTTRPRRARSANLFELRAKTARDPRRRLLEDIEDRFRRKFHGGIVVGTNAWCEFPNDLLTYRYYRSTVEVLAQIAEKFKNWRPGRFGLVMLPSPYMGNYAEGPTDEWGELVDRDEPRSPVLRPHADLIWDGLRPALDGFEATRLKRCPVCGNFFIAWRQDKQACSPPCLRNQRVRKFRAKARDYRENRKATKDRRKKYPQSAASHTKENA